jgi:hypothetical protein
MACAQRRIAVQVRPCQDCGVDIGDQPQHHELCLPCFRRQQPRGHFQIQQRHGRRCLHCCADISIRPTNHTLCYACFLER